MSKKHIVIIVGTRPEAIKLAPVILEIRNKSNFKVTVISSGQHKDLVPSTLSAFGITPDIELDVMSNNQSLFELTSRLFSKLGETLSALGPDLVLAQGDTTTVFVSSTVTFYLQIPFGHVEAGLRSSDINSPFPEEFNRRVTSLTATLNFAPTEESRKNLIRDCVSASSIFVTGNTVIDALHKVVDMAHQLPFSIPNNKKIILLTAHRRENFGESHRKIFNALIDILNKHKDAHLIYPVHPNPNVKDLAIEMFSNLENAQLTPPLRYEHLATLMNKAMFVVTDSGGIQEEAPALNKPVVVLRTETERPEIIEAGAGILAGTETQRVFSIVDRMLTDRSFFEQFVIGFSPVGDGKSSERILRIIKEYLV